MRTDNIVTNGDPGLGGASRECQTAAQLVELLQTAYPITWEQLLRKRLGALGVAEPADLTPAKLAEFRDHVFWSVKQTGIKDPAAWISHRAQVDPKAPAPKQRCSVQVEDTAGQSGLWGAGGGHGGTTKFCGAGAGLPRKQPRHSLRHLGPPFGATNRFLRDDKSRGTEPRQRSHRGWRKPTCYCREACVR